MNTIETLAFSETSIECLSIPATITELREEWCANNPKLKDVKLQKKPNPETAKTNSSSEKVVEKKSNENEDSLTDKIVTNSDENGVSLNGKDDENNSDANDVSVTDKVISNSAEKQLATSSSISSTNLLDNLLCPICHLVMLPPNRTPMIIPGCGHTICEDCISKLDECPFCHQKFVKATRNMRAVQLIESIKD